MAPCLLGCPREMSRCQLIYFVLIGCNALAVPHLLFWAARSPTMLSRTTHSHVTFQRPFRLTGMDGMAPAGRYRVVLEEERLDSLTTEVWRQTAVIVQVTAAGMTDHVTVTPQELRAAILRDGEPSVEPVVSSPDPRLHDVLRLKKT